MEGVAGSIHASRAASSDQDDFMDLMAPTGPYNPYDVNPDKLAPESSRGGGRPGVSSPTPTRPRRTPEEVDAAKNKWFEEETARRAAKEEDTEKDIVMKVFQQLAANGIESNKLVGTLSGKTSEKVGIVPAKFKGEKSDAVRFLIALKLYVRSNTGLYNNDDKKLALAFSLCEDRAGAWIQPYMSNSLCRLEKVEEGDDYDSDLNQDSSPFDSDDFTIFSFKDFTAKFKEAWYSSDPEVEARNALAKITQGKGTVLSYYTSFMTVAAATRYSEIDLRDRFKRGLHEDVIKVIAGWDRDMMTIRKIYLAATKAESQMAEFTGKSSQGYRGTLGINNNWRSKPDAPAGQRFTPAERAQGMAPMEVDAGTFVCYNCYEKGHAAAQCSNEKKPYRKVVFKKNPDKKIAVTGTAPVSTEERPSSSSKVPSPSPDQIKFDDLQKKFDEMNLKFGSLVDHLTKREQKDF